MALSGNQPIGTTARLGVARLGASRLSATPAADQLIPGTGLYAWSDEDRLPPGSVSGGWTVVRS